MTLQNEFFLSSYGDQKPCVLVVFYFVFWKHFNNSSEKHANNPASHGFLTMKNVVCAKSESDNG